MKKYLIFIAFIVVCFNAFPDSASAVWYSSSWTYRKAITIDNTKVAGSADHTSFPILVDLTDAGLQANAQADGDDILFTSVDGTTKLDHEIDLYTTATGRLTAWVRIPTLDYDNDTIIYMYYGNSGASSQQNATGVWDSNYKAVYHLKDGTSLNVNDSTSNSVNFTNSGAAAISGKVDGAADFDGTDQMYTGSSVTSPGTYTMSAWVKLDTLPVATDGGYFVLGLTEVTTGTAAEWSHLIGVRNTGKVYSYLYDGATNRAESTNTVSTGNWFYLTSAVVSGGTNKVFLNGVEEASNALATPFSGWSTGPYLGISKLTNTFVDFGFTTRLDGIVDEARLSNTNRSADWIKTEYNNQSATSTFYTIGSQESDTTAAVPDRNRRLLSI